MLGSIQLNPSYTMAWENVGGAPHLSAQSYAENMVLKLWFLPLSYLKQGKTNLKSLLNILKGLTLKIMFFTAQEMSLHICPTADMQEENDD